MFFHIPLYALHAYRSWLQLIVYYLRRQEAYNTPDKNFRTGQWLDVGLHNLEKADVAKKNEGFFEKGLLKATESDHRAGGNIPEVKVIGTGHAHSRYSTNLIRIQLIGCTVTENCRRVQGLWMCFGAGR